jgi:hypothetical protein
MRIAGRWRITEAELWDLDALNLASALRVTLRFAPVRPSLSGCRALDGRSN